MKSVLMQAASQPAFSGTSDRMPIRLLIAAIVTIRIVCGCAQQTTTGPESPGQTQEDSPPVISRDPPRVDRAFHNKARLWLAYTASGNQYLVSATTEPAGENVLAVRGKDKPVRTLAPVTERVMLAAQAHGTPVPVLPQAEWQHLLDTALQSLAPEEYGHGAVVDILHEEELFLYRVPGGALVSVPLVYKPSGFQVTATYTFADLLAVIHRKLATDYPDGDILLFETGDDTVYGHPFVYADTKSGQSFFLRQEPDAEYSGAMLFGTTLEILAHTAADQIRALFNQPVSSVSRLFTLAGSITADLARPTPYSLLEHAPLPPLNHGAGMDPAGWEAALDGITGRKSSAGRLTYHVGGAEFFPRLISLVGSAGKSVHLRVYIFDNDDYAMDFADLLKRRSDDIDIRVLVDGLGTRGAKMARAASIPPGHKPEFSILHYLASDSGVRVRTVPNVWLTGDHTKTILVDDSIAFLGGMNIGREYRYDWHDMMVEIAGPVVSEVADEFRRAWSSAGLLGDLKRIFSRDRADNIAATASDYPLRLLYTRPGNPEILRAQIAATRRARSHIYLENPYLTSDAMLYELVKARRRGVDVRIIMPYRTDSGLIARSNALTANVMLRNGIRVYIYPGMSHLKAAQYDGWICLGSANLDRLSLRTNREMNLATSHAPAVDALYERVFAADMQTAVELTEPLPGNWADYLAELLADYL